MYRRSGIEISKNLKRDKHGMEDLDDYFNEEDEIPEPPGRGGSSSRSVDRTVNSTRSMDTGSSSNKRSSLTAGNRRPDKTPSRAAVSPAKRKNVVSSAAKPTPQRSRMARDDDDSDDDAILSRSNNNNGLLDDDESDMELASTSNNKRVSPNKSKSKSYSSRREPEPESEEEEEEEPINNMPEEEDEEEEEEEEAPAPPPSKAQKSKSQQSPKSSKRGTPANSRKQPTAKATPKPSASQPVKTSKSTKQPAKPKPSTEVQAPRRSSRSRVQPLAFWRNEKIVYELDHEHHRPQIKEVVYTEPAPENPIRTAKRRKPQPPKRKPKKTDDDSAESDQDIPEWEKNDNIETEVFEYPDTEESTHRIVAWAPGHEPFRDIKNSSYRLATLYDRDSGFSAAGIISLQPGGQKPMKPSKQNSYIFYVISGRVEVNVSDTVFSLRKGGSFEVPRGNYYSITNAATTGETRLFFTQSTDTLVNQELEAAMQEEEQ